jgi:hypothetical protein
MEAQAGTGSNSGFPAFVFCWQRTHICSSAHSAAVLRDLGDLGFFSLKAEKIKISKR